MVHFPTGFPNPFGSAAALHAKTVPNVQAPEKGLSSISPSSLDWTSLGLPAFGGGKVVAAHDSVIAAFDHSAVKPWDPNRFHRTRKLHDAVRNNGEVVLMKDTRMNSSYAVKEMPNEWVRGSHDEFVQHYPTEKEQPWRDIGCVAFLQAKGFAYACELIGVYRDSNSTYVVTSFASEGDLHDWSRQGAPAGPSREQAVLPVARQMMQAVQALHNLGLVHRDLSLENIILAKGSNDSLHVRLIDFSMASMARYFPQCRQGDGKDLYQAPEMHSCEVYDAFLADAFALGVVLYALIVKDYPWMSTRPGECKHWDYVSQHGFRSYIQNRKLRNSNKCVSQVMSEPLQELLEGLLSISPMNRLTLGETAWSLAGNARRSVWDTEWMSGLAVHGGPCGTLCSQI